MTFPRRSLDTLASSVDYGVTASANPDPVGPKFLRITDIQDDRVDWATVPYCDVTQAEAESARLNPGDVVFARTGATTGKSYLLNDCPKGAVFASYLIRVRPREADVDPRYLAWYFQTPDYWRQITSSASGTAQPGVNATKLRALSVPTPPLREQRRIADILDKADAVRRKRKEAIALTEELLRSAFLEMFGDPVTNPKGWPVKPLGSLIEVKSGTFLPAKAMDPAGTCAVYGGNGINGRHSSFMFEEPVITIGRVGAYCGAVHLTEPRSWVTDNALYVSRIQDDLDVVYLEHALRLADLNQRANQAAQPLISASRIYPVAMLVPSVAAQRAFRSVAAAHGRLLTRGGSATEVSDQLFRVLQARAFRGEESRT